MSQNLNARKWRRAANSPTTDAGSVLNNSYNDLAGVQKFSDFGKHLLPIRLDPDGVNAAAKYTTDASTERIVKAGTTLAIFNKGSATAAITISETTISAALALGAVNDAGDVGIPVAAGQWLHLNTYYKTRIRTTSSDLVVFVVADDTFTVPR